MKKDKKHAWMAVMIVSFVCFMIAVIFHYVDKRLGYYLGFARALILIGAGIGFLIVMYRIRKRHRDQIRIKDIGMLLWKMVILLAGFVAIVTGFYMIERLFKQESLKISDWIICLCGFGIIVILCFLLPKIKTWWKKTAISSGMVTMMFLAGFTFLGIYSFVGGGVMLMQHIQDIAYLDCPKQVMLFHCSEVHKHTSRGVFYTQMKGYDEFHKMWTFDLSLIKLNKQAHDGYCIVEYLPHSETLLSISFYDDGIEW